MDKQAAIRRVRIAVSVFFGVLTVALCVLWVRSYWYVDTVSVTSKSGARLRSVMSGCGVLCINDWSPAYRRWAGGVWKREIMPVQERWIARFRDTPKFQFDRSADGWGIDLPYWLFVMSAGVASAMPGMQSRFSLRTMLIATTLVAVVLGLGVWIAS